MQGTGQGSIPIVRGGQPAAVIVLGEEASEMEQLAASELARYIERLAYARLDVASPNEIGTTGEKALVLVGPPGSNRLIDQALGGAHDGRKLKAEGFVLHTGRLRGRGAAVVSGKDEIGTVYGAYAMLEKLGATFLTDRRSPP